MNSIGELALYMETKTLVDENRYPNQPQRVRRIVLSINGDSHSIEVDARSTLAEVLRENLRMTGTKLGCNRSECGTCTLIMDGRTVFSCTVLAVEAEGKRIETIEGLANGSDLHPLQKAFIDNDALQCGYCIPAMLMAAKALLSVKMEPTEDDVKQGIAGVYCRCGAYPNIVRAVLDASRGKVDC